MCIMLSTLSPKRHEHTLILADRELRAFICFLNVPLPIHIFMYVAIVSHTFLSRSDSRTTMKIHQIEFHDQFVFSGPLVEIEKSRGLATARRKIISLFYFIFFFLCCCSVWRERTDNKKNGLRLRKKSL